MGTRALKHLLRRPDRRGINWDPYDRTIRERLAQQMFEHRNNDQPLGTVSRARLLLDLIEETFPTDALTTAYFENLALLLQSKQPLHSPGKVVLGLGSGRSGSTSLVAILRTIGGCCCTHENPPLVSWTPEPEELQFHIRRFETLAKYFTVVADVSHWWLNAAGDIFSYFPGAKAVALIRNTESCVKSFMGIKGLGRGSYNHWVPYGSGVWAVARWDPTYPTYALPENAHKDPDRVKFELIERYVREYNAQLCSLAQNAPEKILLVKTGELSDPTVQNAIFDFVGVQGSVSEAKLNVATVADGQMPDLRF